MQVINDGLTGQLNSRTRALASGQAMHVRLTRKEFGDYRPENIVGVIVIDDIGQTFSADPNQLQGCIAELFTDR